MPSLRATFLNYTLKWVVKRRPLHLSDPDELRALVDKAAPKTAPDDIDLEVVDAAPMRGEWHRAKNPDGVQNAVTILYLHGGGYVFGSPKSHRGVTFALARHCAADVFSLSYRLAPENPFPAAVDDALAAYQGLLDEGRDPARIIVAGDSAGGGLALALLVSCRDRGLPMPAGAVLFSPWTDLAATGPSLSTNEKTDVMFKKVYIAEGAKKYLAKAHPKAPLASPLYAEHSGLPPILTFVSASEALLDDSMRLHEKLKAAGVDAEIVIEPGLAHVWPVFVGNIPEAEKAIQQAVEFILNRTESADAA